MSRGGVFGRLDGHEQVVFGHDPGTGLRCIVAIHSTVRGPSLGGTRFRDYPDETAALDDVLRLSRAMTYKAACAGLDHGGGKAVILSEGRPRAPEALLAAYGRLVDSLGGRYVTACDVGTYPEDMVVVARHTRWATGLPASEGGSGDSGVLTAYGVYVGMRAAAGWRWREPSLAGRHVAVQGVGKVGRRLVGHLLGDGARVTVADVDDDRVARVADEHDVAVVAPDEILAVDADVVSPNALGGVLDAGSIPTIEAEVVCGGANNQLATGGDARRLADRGILYAPDYVVNAGGLIGVADELDPRGHNPGRCRRRTGRIGDTLRQVLATAERRGITTEAAAREVAEDRIRSGPSDPP